MRPLSRQELPQIDGALVQRRFAVFNRTFVSAVFHFDADRAPVARIGQHGKEAAGELAQRALTIDSLPKYSAAGITFCK